MATKIELEQQIEQLTEEKKYLAQAVEDKDREISKLKQNTDHTAVDAELQNVKAENERLKQQVKTLESRVDELEQIERRRVDELNNYIFMHGAFIKTVQGALETASLLNDKVTKQVME